jgi:hypothetical protein
MSISSLDRVEWNLSPTMYKLDQEKTSVITYQVLYCYKVIPFRLKNAGATYQRLVNIMFRQQMGRNLEVIIDDMLLVVSNLVSTFSITTQKIINW